MYKISFYICLILLSVSAKSQVTFKGSIWDTKTKLPVEGVTITLMPANIFAVTDAAGRFSFKGKYDSSEFIITNNIGYAPRKFTSGEIIRNNKLFISQQQIELQNIIIVSPAGDIYKPISRTDIEMRGVSNSQEVLRIIPGIVISQHQGGGKAEQIFLRGFDADHGTDFREEVDGLPVNMTSHAHGQGFADSHFIIPETIESVDFKKGPYGAARGDFATTGYVDFITKDGFENNVVKLEGGMFNTFRGLGMFNLLQAKAKEKQQSWYVASEYRYSDAYFDNPQHFNRFNLFTKYTGRISKKSTVTVSATTFWSKWNASGQIPSRAVKEGLISFYGTLDPFEGGLTYRTNINVKLITALNKEGVIKNQLYYSNYHFDLHTNFTFFLVDTVNGDEIRQQEARDILGYNGSYNHTDYWGAIKLNTDAGINVRADLTHNSALSHTVDRYTILNRVKLGDISEASISPYVSEIFTFNRHLVVNAAIRLDQFHHTYHNKLASDTTLPGIGVYKANANTLSPKLNFYYHVNDKMQFYLATGKGFHSNDTRAVVVEHGYQILPSAYGADLGTVFKPINNVLINAAIWYIYLQQEFVYAGDGGDVSFNGPTRRIGFDFSGRYQPARSLYFDFDLNYAHGRSTNKGKEENYIPLAPVVTSTGGITLLNNHGLNGSVRYRYIGDRPANQNYSLTATGYMITDAVFNYTKPSYEIGLVINNIFNTRWKETQFDAITRLRGEAQPVDEICFTPGTRFAAKLSLSIFFK